MHIVLRHDLSTMTAAASASTSASIDGAPENHPATTTVNTTATPTKHNSPAKTTTSSPSHLTLRQMFRVSQPAHMIVLVALMFLGFVLFPKHARSSSEASTLTNIIYLGSFAFHFGAQMWMTFISGIVLFFTIPRHVFGLVQKQLFPKYFLINSILAFLTLAAFLHHHPTQTWTTQETTQVWALAVCFFAELLTRLYVVPVMLTTLQIRMSMEMKAGVGSEIGRHEKGKLKNCTQYLRLNRYFRRLHGITAIANMIALGCNGFHLYHLATVLCKL